VTTSDAATIYLYGENNLINSGVEMYNGTSGAAATRNFYLGNRHAFDPAVTSAATITLSRNYDTYNVTGTTDIVNIAMSGTYTVAEYGLLTIKLIMASTAKFKSAGNIVPQHENARVAGEVVQFTYNMVTKKWNETY
jgi:hypothetical protein